MGSFLGLGWVPPRVAFQHRIVAANDLAEWRSIDGAFSCKNPTPAPARQVSAGPATPYGITLAGARFITQSPVRMSDTKMLPL